MSSLENAELRRFTAFQQLPEDQIAAILKQFPVRSALAGTQLVAKGSYNMNDLFLISGVVRVTNENGEETFIDDRSPLATEPLAKRRPREVDIVAASDVDYMLLPPNLHRLDLTHTEEIDIGGSVRRHRKVAINHKPPNVSLDDLLSAVDADLARNELALPTSVEISTPIQRYVMNSHASPDELLEALLLEPTLCFKLLIKARNGNANLETLEQAVEHLSIESALSFITHDHEHEQCSIEHQVIRKQAIQTIKKSFFIASVSEALAEKTDNLDPQIARVAGLFHNIGTFTLLNYIEHSATFSFIADLPEVKKQKLADAISLKLLEYYNFDEKFLHVISDAQQWDRDPYGVADYADLVNVAHLHYFMGKPECKNYPSLDTIPAAQKIYGGKLDAKISGKIVNDAWERINTLKSKIKEKSTIDSTN